MKYSIRLPHKGGVDDWLTDQIYYVSPSRASRIQFIPIGPPYYTENPPYFSRCFIGIQNEIDRAFINQLNSSVALPNVLLQPFPYPAVDEDMFVEVSVAGFPLLLVMAMLMSAKNIIKVKF